MMMSLVNPNTLYPDTLALGLGPKRASIETRMMMSLVNYMTGIEKVSDLI